MKIIVLAKKVTVIILAHVFMRIVTYLKSTSVTECNEIIIVMNIVSTTMTIATNVTSMASIDCHNIKVRDCHILHIFCHIFHFISYHTAIYNYYYLLS